MVETWVMVAGAIVLVAIVISLLKKLFKVAVVVAAFALIVWAITNLL